MRSLCPLLLLAASAAFSQTSDRRLTFEVASVKLNPPHDGEPVGSKFNGGPGTSDPERITVINRMLRTLIIDAYGIRGYQIEHPAWMQENRYDIFAKVPPGATPGEAKAMMRNLLDDRFDLKIRREMRDLPVYVLTVAKGGVKMKPSQEAQPAISAESLASGRLKADGDGFTQLPPNVQTILESYTGEGAKATGQRQSIARIATWLAAHSDRPVIDETGLEGNYDFSFKWSPDQNGSGIDYGLPPAVEKQLGLKMESRKVPTEMLIVVSALKAPKEN
jgi:uncharacterized protein (TIGR03435 family)